MEKSTKAWIWVGVGLAVATITGIALYRRNKNKEAEQAEKEAKEAEKKEKLTPPPAKQSVKTTGITFPIQRGSDGYGVKVVQAFYNTFCSGALKREKVFPLTVDGDWGGKTETAAKSCGEFNRFNKVDKVMYERMFARLDNVKRLPA